MKNNSSESLRRVLRHLKPYTGWIVLALLCAAAVFCAPSIRLGCGVLLCGGALVLAALHPLPQTLNAAAACALCVAAFLLNLKQVFLRRV